MSENHDSKQVLKDSGPVGNGDSTDPQSAPVKDDAARSGNSGEASVNVESVDADGTANTINQEPSFVQVDHVDHSNGVVLTRDDTEEIDLTHERTMEDGGKEEMFVDCPDELIVSENREAMATPETQQSSEEMVDMRDTRIHESDNGTHTIGDKEGSVQEYKEERDAFMKELANLHHQLKALNGQQSLLHENSYGSVDGFEKEEIGEVGERISLSDNLLHGMMIECSKFVMNARNIGLQKEESFRELQAMLTMKSQEIEDLHSEVTELSISQDIVLSFLSSAQSWSDSLKSSPEVQDEQQHVEAIANRVLASLAMAVNEEDELLDDSISGKLSQVEKNTSLLIEKYNHFLSKIDLLRQCLTEVRSDFSAQDEFGTTLVVTCDVLLDLKRKEVDWAQKISNLEDENKKLVERVDKGKETVEIANADVEKLRVELEHEKTKYANTKEKLSLAVTKGKALVQQRDLLKQTLADITTELEKCLVELQEKSSALEAAETSKVELARTENLAAALQDTLSQRNAVLAQCEEILSKTTASQELRSADIMDKIRLLMDERNTLKGVMQEFNNLQDALSMIDLPESVLSSNLESRVSWLVESFSQAKGEANKLQYEIIRTSEDAHYEIERLTTTLLAETQEKTYLQEELQDLNHKYKEIVEKECQVSLEKDRMVNMLLEASGITMDSHEESDQPPSDVTTLVDRCLDKIKASSASFEPSGLDADSHERMQTLMYIKDQELMLCEKLLEDDTLVRLNVNTLLDELRTVSQELEALKDEKSALQKDLERSEEKSGLLREKLSMAVKKGKGLVQERENLKKFLDEKTAEIVKLKLELQQQESALSDCKDWISKLSTDVGLIPELEADVTTIKGSKDQLEQFLVESNNMLKRLVESIDSIVLPVDLSFEEPVEKVQWLAGYLNECQVAKTRVDQELEKLKVESTNLSSKLTEVYTANKSLEEALSSAETDISQLAEEKKELEVGKTYVEQELQKALEEASSQAVKFADMYATRKPLEDALSEAENKISVLMNEREDSQLSKTAAEAELEKVKEEVFTQTTKLAEAYRTIKSLEDALSQVENNVSFLSEENNNAQVGRTNLESEMMKLKEEVDSQSRKNADACLTINSLKDALLKAENNISELLSEKKNAEEEISILNSKLNACIKELAGTTSSLESRSLELSSHLNNLQLLLKDDTLLSLIRQSFETKLESLKDVDLLLKDIKDHFVETESETLQSYPIAEEDSYVSKFSVLDNIANVDTDNCKGNAEDGDSFESYFRKQVEGFHFRNKIIADKVECFSTFLDEFIAALMTKLRATRDKLAVKLEEMKSLKQRVNNLEMLKQAQESRIVILENDITTLLSVCGHATQELEIEVENSPMELSSAPELEKLNNLFTEVREVSEDAVEENPQMFDSSKCIKTAKNLLLAARKVGALSKEFENVKNVSAAAIKDLENELSETKLTLENAIQERDLNQNRLSKLERDLEAIQTSYQEMRFELEDYQAKEDKLNDREAEISSLQTNLLMKEKEAEVASLLASQVKTLYDKINDIVVPFAEFNVGDTEFHESDHAKKVFYIVDAVASMQRQMNLLSHDKEELQSILAKQVHQIQCLEEEAEEYIRDKQDYEKTKNELSEVWLGLENIVQKLGGGDLVGEQKSAGSRGLLPALEKLITALILESENSKSKAQELGAKLLGSQKVVDELSAKVKLIEDSYQSRSASPEGAQETSIFEAPSLPSRSEITEIEDMGPLAKKAVASASSAAHVRTLRKGSNDHLAINIDTESDRLIKNEETDEDKGHLFKSLNTSGLIPKQGRILADRVDGIWVSGGRALMSRPRARLGLVAYWLFLHIWLLGTIL
ncbi:hypothetical protein U1Q18_029054 [Sarracenia purpurea var. burkii]